MHHNNIQCDKKYALSCNKLAACDVSKVFFISTMLNKTGAEREGFFTLKVVVSSA